MKEEFPDMQGLSRRNLFNIQKFYRFHGDQLMQQPVALLQNIHNHGNELIQQSVGQNVQQLVALIPWVENPLILTPAFRGIHSVVFTLTT